MPVDLSFVVTEQNYFHHLVASGTQVVSLPGSCMCVCVRLNGGTYFLCYFDSLCLFGFEHKSCY